MDLYFLRHGKAIDPRSPGCPDDFHRVLTAQGIQEMEAEADALARFGVRPDRILTSPLVRARETATIVAERLDCEKALVVNDLLAPGCDLERLTKLLQEHAAANSVFVVGHEPDLSTLIGNVIGRSGANIDMKKGALALVQSPWPVRRGSGTLRWLVYPKLLVASRG